jgi:nucleoside 2-deoxyribosyltransferase
MENVSLSSAQGWRENARHTLKTYYGISTLDPTRRLHSGDQKHMRRIFECDLKDIRNCDIVLANLNDDTLPKHGTAIELFYANYVLRKPVVAFKQELTKFHPFFESIVTEWRSDVWKACDTIGREYK